MWDILIVVLFFSSALILIFYYIDHSFSIRENANRCSPDSKDFKIGDPVVASYLPYKFFSFIDGYDPYDDEFHIETDRWFSPDKLRHPTPEELEKYFRK